MSKDSVGLICPSRFGASVGLIRQSTELEVAWHLRTTHLRDILAGHWNVAVRVCFILVVVQPRRGEELVETKPPLAEVENLTLG